MSTRKTSKKQLEKILALTGTKASEAFLKEYEKNAAKDIMEYVCAQLDEKYEPQHTFWKREFILLDEDMPVTYAMYNKVDDSSSIIASKLDYDSDTIADDETLFHYIKRSLDSRMDGLPTRDGETGSSSLSYGPKDFFNALCDGEWHHTAEMDKILEKCYVEWVADSESVSGSLLHEFFGTVEVDNVVYRVTYYVPDEAGKEEAENRGDTSVDLGNLDWDKFQIDIHFGGFVD